jgi:hypothetical protein
MTGVRSARATLVFFCALLLHVVLPLGRYAPPCTSRVTPCSRLFVRSRDRPWLASANWTVHGAALRKSRREKLAVVEREATSVRGQRDDLEGACGLPHSWRMAPEASNALRREDDIQSVAGETDPAPSLLKSL